MSNIFELDKIPDGTDKINMEDLYENKQKHDQQQLELFNKILCKIHTRIKYISNQRNNPLCCWHIIPETMLGVPRYNQSSCIAYIINKLETNGFIVKYIHPNLIFISWNNYIPSYIRKQIKEKTGIQIDSHGEIIEENNNNEINSNNKDNINQDSYNPSPFNIDKKNKTDKNYTPLNKYKPTGKLIYDDEYLNL
jgi:hypothetical protein